MGRSPKHSHLLLNLLHSSAIDHLAPYEALYGVPPDDSSLHVFGYLCYSNVASSAPHKLSPRSLPCVFLGYPAHLKGFRCLDHATGKVIISRHVIFYESTFPFSTPSPSRPSSSPPDDDTLSLHILDHLLAPAPVVTQPVPRPSPPTVISSALVAPAPPAPPTQSHHMTTRSKSGIFKPKVPLSLATNPSSISHIPRIYSDALLDPNWRQAMFNEFAAFIKNKTWELVPRPTPSTNVVSGKCIFRHKFNSDGSLDRYKAQWVARGFNQQHGMDFDETFSHVVKPTTMHTVLTIAISRGWPIHQLDVANAFLHGPLNEPVFCEQPSGFVDPARSDFVCRLHNALYGLKQAPQAWFQRFAHHIGSLGFTASKSDTSQHHPHNIELY